MKVHEFVPNLPSPIQKIALNGDYLWIKREDLLHPYLSGNKWRKLKYNLIHAQERGFSELSTFGGSFSNHLLAVAAAGHLFNFKTTGIVRGNELSKNSSPILLRCYELGMKLFFVSRHEYATQKEELTQKFSPKAYSLPEGGTNELALLGVKELYDEIITQIHPDFIIVPVGTGGTFLGLLQSSASETIIGVDVLKGYDRVFDIQQSTTKTNYKIWSDFHWGGYAKTAPELTTFINSFMKTHTIPLEKVYSGKMMYGILNELNLGRFPKKSTILAIHTGGLHYF